MDPARPDLPVADPGRRAGSGTAQSGYTRQSIGGCGFWNSDADWANSTALNTINTTVRAAIGQSGLTNTRLLELQSAFNGRRLCENTVGLYEEVGLSSWTQPTAVDKTEWINQIRTVTTIGSDYYIQESLHPNYWAQLATPLLRPPDLHPEPRRHLHHRRPRPHQRRTPDDPQLTRTNRPPYPWLGYGGRCRQAGISSGSGLCRR